MKQVKITVKGDVQEVFYRYHAKKMAKELGISGWAKNEHDGSVTIVAKGTESAIKEYQNWAKIGSPMATVSEVAIEEMEMDEALKGFVVK